MVTKVYSVTTCKFTNREKTNNISKLNADNYMERYCVLESDDNTVTDIFTNESFFALYRTEDNKIFSFKKINLGQEYAISIHSLDLNKLSKRELLKLKYAYLKLTLLNKFKKIEVQKQNVIKR